MGLIFLSWHLIGDAKLFAGQWRCRRVRVNLDNALMKACFLVLFALGVDESLVTFSGGMFGVVAFVANDLAVDLSLAGLLPSCLNSYR